MIEPTTRYYLGVPVTPLDDPPEGWPAAAEGWTWARWPDGREFCHWTAQLHMTPWARLGVIDADGNLAQRGSIEWTETIGGAKSWRGLAPGDRIYIDDRLAFVADDIASGLTR